jgi:hypothetical protein
VIEVQQLEVFRKVFDDLFSGEVVPRWSVSVAEAYEEVFGFWFEYASDTSDELGSVFNFNVVEAAHVKYEVECNVSER